MVNIMENIFTDVRMSRVNRFIFTLSLPYLHLQLLNIDCALSSSCIYCDLNNH